VLATSLLLAAVLHSASASGDITADILAGRDITLSGAAKITVPAGTTTYDGVIRGEGTLRISGPGTLILTRDSDFTLPRAQQRQQVTIPGGNHPYVVVGNPDPPAVIVDRGATLQYGNGGGSGLIGHFPYNTPGFQLNQDNIEVNGTLRLSLTRAFNLGTISGSGLITQPRFLWGTLDLAGSQPFSGVIDNGTGTAAGKPETAVALPNARAILNQGTWTIDTPLDQTVVLRQNFYQREYGSDINVQSRPGGKVVLTGQYSYSDRGGDTDPSLSDPGLNWRKIPHDRNKRGTNIKGADVQWGDGSTDEIFMPGTADTVYINLLAARSRSKLTFAYGGPVTLGAPIGGGVFHDTLKSPGAGDIVIKGVRGNDVTFAAHQYYDGSTTIERGAVLRLGSGRTGGDGSLLTKASLFKVVNDGSLVVQNGRSAISLSRISGTGSFVQAGRATTRLTGNLSYTGRTTISQGTLAVAGGSLRSSKAVALTRAGARLDLTAAGNQSLQNLTMAAGTTLASNRRAVVSLTGRSVLAGTFSGGTLANTGTLTGPFSVTGNFTQSRTGRLTIPLTAKPPQVTGTLDLAGTLQIPGATAQPGTTTAKPTHPTASTSQPGTARPSATSQPGATAIVLINNAGAAPVSGSFSGLPEGAKVSLRGTQYAITYRGGTGNDVTLEPVRADAPAVAPNQPTGAKTPTAPVATTGGSSYWRSAGLAAVAAVIFGAGVLLVGRFRRRSSSSRG
jgi:autotransporter-associated beta strand protein